MSHDPDLNRHCPRCGADCERPDGYPAMHDPDCRFSAGFDVAEGHEVCAGCREWLDAGEMYLSRLSGDRLHSGQETWSVVCLGCAVHAPVAA